MRTGSRMFLVVDFAYTRVVLAKKLLPTVIHAALEYYTPCSNQPSRNKARGKRKKLATNQSLCNRKMKKLPSLSLLLRCISRTRII